MSRKPAGAGKVARLALAGLSLAALASVAACASAGSGAPAELRVLVYNIHAGKDAAGVDNLERVAAIVRDARADIVLLQEVDRGTTRSGKVDQLAELERRTAMHGAFGKTLDYQGGDYGIAVLSRWPIRDDTLIRLPVEPPQARAGGSYEPRGALVAVLESPGVPIRVINTHLDASRDDHYRRQEAVRVLAEARALAADSSGGAPLVLVGGDFNAEPGTPTHGTMTDAGLRDAWASCGSGDGLTFSAAQPVKRIDYLFVSGRAGCGEARVLATDASDHRPLLVTLRP